MNKQFNKVIKLPIIEPIYSTYHTEAIGSAIISQNPTIKNWYLNYPMQLSCNRKFIGNYTTPEVYIKESAYWCNPYLIKLPIPMKHLGVHLHDVIKAYLDDGFYVYYRDLDDFYIAGKSWYKQRHFYHDGLICGYDQLENTYDIFAYDINWKCRVFQTSQKGVEAARKSAFKAGVFGEICALKPSLQSVAIDESQILNGIAEYLDSDLEKYPPYIEDTAYGIVVHDYIAIYLCKQLTGAFPYEKIDRRIFREFWVHKRTMLERIQALETKFGWSTFLSEQYRPLVKEADNMRMLYASHIAKRRDSILSTLKQKVLEIKEKEKCLLSLLITKRKAELNFENMAQTSQCDE